MEGENRSPRRGWLRRVFQGLEKRRAGLPRVGKNAATPPRDTAKATRLFSAGCGCAPPFRMIPSGTKEATESLLAASFQPERQRDLRPKVIHHLAGLRCPASYDSAINDSVEKNTVRYERKLRHQRTLRDDSALARAGLFTMKIENEDEDDSHMDEDDEKRPPHTCVRRRRRRRARNARPAKASSEAVPGSGIAAKVMTWPPLARSS